MSPLRAWSPVAAFVLCASASAALAGVDVEVGNGDKVTGTIAPADEVEVFRFRVPQGAAISVKAKSAKGGPSLDVVLAGPDDSPIDFRSGTSVAITGVAAAASGMHSVTVSSEDLTSTGDYSLAISWKSRTSFSATTVVASGDSDSLEFAAEEGASVTLSVKPAKRSPAAGALESLTPPEGDDVPLAGAKAKRTIGVSGDHVLSFTNEGDEDGALVATVKVKPPKVVKRKIALTSRVIGSGDPDGDTAFAAVIGRAGGVVAVPPLAEGEPGAELEGASVVVPANALPAATAIIIATSPDLVPPGGGTGAGTTVFFGPEGAKFDSADGSPAVTVTIPYDAAYDAATESLVIFTRDAKGRVTAVPPPYTFDAATHTVSFATSHFSSFRAATAGTSSVAMLTLASGFTAPRDVCVAFEPGSPPQPALYFVADGSAGTVTALRVSGQPTQFLAKDTWAGGGAATADGTPRLQFDFGGPVVSVYALSDGAVWVATPTQVFRVGTDGLVTRVAGTGTSLDGGDGGPALQATFVDIRSVIVALDETVYVADFGAHRIRVVDPTSQTIATYAGTGTAGLGADGEALDATALFGPSDMDFADDGGLYVADRGRVRHLTAAGASTSLVNVTVAGNAAGGRGGGGDGGPVLDALFTEIAGISVYIDPQDPTATKLAVSDSGDAVVRLLDLDGDVATLIAGEHDIAGDAPDVSPATGRIDTPLGLVALPGEVTFVDSGNGKVRTRFVFGQ